MPQIFRSPSQDSFMLVRRPAWHTRAAIAQVIMALFSLAAALAAHDGAVRGVLFAAGSVVAAVVLWTTLARRESARLLLAWPLLTLVLLTVASFVIPDGARLTVSFIVIAFLFAGLTQPPLASLWLVAPALVVHWSVIDLPPAQAAIRMTIAAFVWVATAELPARLTFDLRTARLQLAREAATDPLTGLANRRGWKVDVERLVHAVSRSGRPLALMLLDLDHFKAFNDRYGHLVGDELLATFARRIQFGLPPEAVVARWGGEEFAIALPDTTPTEAVAVAERIRAAVPMQQTCSVGLTLSGAGDSESSLVARADAALYAAKNAGRDRVAAG
ncbi:GGDEF domain-containing protein [Nocardioides sp. CER19]|uniref:GGDEF domain-containing protein n=1 Tax=Nocardioides sp. CER19 TaxID=3038538 RepID=UPI0024489561|nr:GGDEF domain-containing protein [Nocardioides sp. CER19]MDH2414184.1 GGDEF domain-containing protein [Nocardioides sp. CER19]